MTTPDFGHPAFAMLQFDRWDDGLGWIHTHSHELLGEERSQAVLDASSDRKALRDEIHTAVDHLYTIGTLSAGRAALAWSLLTCNPRQPSTFHRVLPQVQFALDQAELPEGGDADVRDRLRIWWRCAEGEFAKASRSPFAIAAAILRGEEPEEATTVVVRPTMKQVASWFRKPYDGPTLTVMPAARASRLNNHNKIFESILDKPLPLAPARDLAEARKRLGYEFPHAFNALQALFRDLREGQTARVKPTVLVGPAGAGKSRIVGRFARAIGLQFVYHYDGAASADNHFAGTSKAWSNTEASVPTRAVQQSKTANPLVFVDEIDKAATNANGSLFHAMLPFLEVETSKNYRDQSLDSELDLSAVNYVATANNVSVLPDFLQDRFRMIRVPEPRLVDLPLLAASIMEDLAKEDQERAWDDPLATDELQVIAKAWQQAGFSLRNLQVIVKATMNARDQHAMRH
jgi:hypothetical protein